MIDPKELRVGNFVRLNNAEHWPSLTGQEFQVVSIHQEFAGLINNADRETLLSQFYIFIEPIELKQAWLVKMGFVTCLDCMLIRFEQYNIKYLHGVISAGRIDEESMFYLRHINYVHQVQNLHFLLTGEELSLT